MPIGRRDSFDIKHLRQNLSNSRCPSGWDKGFTLRDGEGSQWFVKATKNASGENSLRGPSDPKRPADYFSQSQAFLEFRSTFSRSAALHLFKEAMWRRSLG